ncbi:MAG TPA: GDP-mannose 4,6-dehydratase, partial [Gaiellaceae bacterium]|nr:GDP-mannose 4,6-dehydratase [Gaiellaceae bacterium]
YLLERGQRVICVDNLVSGSLANIEHIRDERFVFLNHDVAEPIHIDEPIDVVYHFAALASPEDYLRMPLHSLKVGSYGTHNALGLAKFKRARFVLASTSEVYGDPQVHPQPETYWGHVNPIGPRGVYDEAKRYAEALTMAYHGQQGVDTAIVRIFNSILADEQVLYDDGRELRREPVEALARRLSLLAQGVAYAGGFGSSLLPAAAYELEGYTVPACAEGARIVAAPAAALVAHPPSGRCYEVRTRYGRSVRVTGDHSIFVEGPDGEPVPRPVEELEVGDRVALVARVDVPERDRTEVDLLDVWRHAEGDPWRLAVEAPGLGALAWGQRHELTGLLAGRRRGRGPVQRLRLLGELLRLRATGRVPLPVLRRVATSVPAGARVRLLGRGRSVAMPARISVSDDLLWLLGLWVARGTTDGHEARLALDDGALLRRAASVVRRELGVRAAVRPGAAIAVRSELVLRLLAYLGVDGEPRRVPGWILGLPLARLKWFLEGYRAAGAGRSRAALEAARRHELPAVGDELKDDLVVCLARFGLVPAVERCATAGGWRLTLSGVAPWSPLDWDAGVRQRLRARRSGDLVWAPIEAIREVEPTPLVYDFSVPGLESFWAGTGLLSHNTYGPRMRPNDGRAVSTFVRQALAQEPITVFGDGSQTRSFCYVDDLIRGIVLLAESGEHLPVNLGNPDERTLLELAETVKRLAGSSSEIVFEALRIDDPMQRQPDITRARQLLGWEPEISLEDGLSRLLRSFGHEPVAV